MTHTAQPEAPQYGAVGTMRPRAAYNGDIMDNDWGKAVSAISRNPFVVGALGAILALRAVPGATLPERIFNVFGGSVCAGYSTPFLAEWMGWKSDSVISFASLIIGLAAMTLVAEFILALKTIKWGELLTNLITTVVQAFARTPKE